MVPFSALFLSSLLSPTFGLPDFRLLDFIKVTLIVHQSSGSCQFVSMSASSLLTTGASMIWSRENTMNFIIYLHQQPALWKIKSDEYRNRDLKIIAINTLIEKMKTHNITMDENYVKKKINNLRSQFRKEYKLFTTSRRSGMAANDLYHPALW